MSWIIVSYMHCGITPQTRKFKAYDDHAPFRCTYDTSEVRSYDAGNTVDENSSVFSLI